MSDSDPGAGPLDALAEEFAARYRRGERPSLSEYIARCPGQAERIRRLFPALVMMEEFGSVEGPPAAAGGVGGPPRRLGDYRILREVGRGGMGVVYEAEQVSLGRRVALKVLPATVAPDGVTLERFRREARAAAKLHHTNIVPVFEVGQEGPVSYYAMQFIRGQGLDLVIKELARLRRHDRPGGASDSNRAVTAEAAGPGVVPPAGREVDRVVRSLMTGRFEVTPPGGTTPHPDVWPAAGSPSEVTGSAARYGPTLAEPGPSPAGPAAPAAVAPTARGPGEPAAASAVLPGGAPLSAAEAGRGHQYHRGVARIGQQVAMALAHAHARGVLHRDIKPSNLLLDEAGVVWVTDFGLAKGEEQGLTQSGDVLGTLRYMAPERFRGEGDARADVYALGLTLYELLTLGPAFDSGDRLRLIERVKSEEPVRPRVRDRRIPRDLETIVLKAADKDPRRRYRTAEEMAEDLRRFQAGETLLARPVGSLERGWRWCRRNPVVAGSLATSAAALVAVAIISTILAVTQIEATRRADLNLAISEYKQGQALCENEEIGPGMLRLISSWRSAVRARDADWQKAARVNLAAWQSHYPTLKNVFHHATIVTRLAFSPDGQTILTGSGDYTARLWDAKSGKPIGEPLTHLGVVSAVAFSPDGKTALTGSEDGTARVWDTTAGKPLGTLLEHRAAVQAMAFSPDGRIVLIGTADGTARLWDPVTGRHVGEPMRHKRLVRDVAFSPDGKTVLTGSEDQTAQQWNAKTGEPFGPSLPHEKEVTSVQFSPLGETILTGCWDGTARFWNAKTGELIGRILTHQIPAHATFSPDGQTVLTNGGHTARLWSAKTLLPMSDLMMHQANVLAMAFSPDGKTALTGSGDGTARVWDTTTGKRIGPILPHQSGVWSVAFSPDGKSILTGTSTGTVRLWSCPTSQSIGRTIEFAQDNIALAFSPVAKFVLIGCDKTAWIWVIDGAKHWGSPMTHDAPIRCVAFSPDGQTILTACEDGSARLWDAAGKFRVRLWDPDGKSKGKPPTHGDRIWTAAFSPDGETVLTGSDDRTARFWDARTGAPIGLPLKHEGRVTSVAFSPDGTKFLIGCGDKTARLWDFATRRPIGPPLPHDSEVNAVAFRPDGQRIFTGEDGRAWIWDRSTATRLGPPMRHFGSVEAVAFSPGGETILTSAWDSMARLWDTATGQPIGPPMWHAETALATTFRPGDKTMLTGTVTGTVRIWPTAVLPDDLERVTTWVEALTALTLDDFGSVLPLDRDAWLERRERVRRGGGRPPKGPGW